MTVQTVLVCVRSAPAAQSVAACAHRLGVAPAVRTAVTATEAMNQLARQPAEIILVDTALTRPDTVGFTRRAVAAAPAATIVLFGAEDPQTARAAIDAGARGLIGGGDHESVTAVAKALLLVLERTPAGTPAARPVAERPPVPGPHTTVPPTPPGSWQGNRAAATATSGAPRHAVLPGALPAVVPAQRADAPFGAEAPNTVARPTRSVALTERELQVLRGMADGRSNAEIGRELFVSEDTVKTHARRLFRKLGARDRAHAVASGFRQGLVS